MNINLDYLVLYFSIILNLVNKNLFIYSSFVCGWVEVLAMKNIFVISMHGTIMAPYEPILIFGRHVPPLAILITKIRWSARTSTHIVLSS